MNKLELELELDIRKNKGRGKCYQPSRRPRLITLTHWRNVLHANTHVRNREFTSKSHL